MDNKLKTIKNFLEQKYDFTCTMANSMACDLKNELGIEVINFVGLIKRDYYENSSNISDDEIDVWGISGAKKHFIPYSYIEIDQTEDGGYQVQCKGFVPKKILKEIDDLLKSD
ncbi:MAG: hypothetical protein PHQ62_03055 [Clostridia bacterium]|nr:hypothetical protein [Clostridia bacterium]